LKAIETNGIENGFATFSKK